MRKKILFTGGSGLLALNWAYQIRNSYDIFLGLHEKIINVSGVTSVMISLENEVDFLNSIQNIKPDLIIHTAGMTNVDLCEADPNMASKINFEAVKYVSNVSECAGGKCGPKFKDGSQCSKCTFYKQIDGTKGTCTLVKPGYVTASGWCTSFNKKAGA